MCFDDRDHVFSDDNSGRNKRCFVQPRVECRGVAGKSNGFGTGDGDKVAIASILCAADGGDGQQQLKIFIFI